MLSPTKAADTAPSHAEATRTVIITAPSGLDCKVASALEQLSMTGPPAERDVTVEFRVGEQAADPRTTLGDDGKLGDFQLLSLAGGIGSEVRVLVQGLDEAAAKAYLDSVEEILAPPKQTKA